jgi:hypothetical protein
MTVGEIDTALVHQQKDFAERAVLLQRARDCEAPRASQDRSP